jgi:hypothetical protein
LRLTLFYDARNQEVVCSNCHVGTIQSALMRGRYATIGNDEWNVDGNHPNNQRRKAASPTTKT